jgi:hypothetical protein
MLRTAPIIAVITLVTLSAPVQADKLPKSAKPLSPQEITKIYSGNSSDWKASSAYFAPDGTVKGYVGKPKIKSTFKGNWAVSDNEVCMEFSTQDGFNSTDCWKYWRSGKDILTLWSRHFDGSAVDDVNGYYKNEVAKLKAGDLVSAKYAEAGGH